MKQWYTFHTKPNAEYQVATSLRHQGFQTYLPEIEIPKVHSGQRRKPFFPCYLFAKIDFEVVALSQVQWTPGLRHVVAFDNQPVPLVDEVIDLIRLKLDETIATAGQLAHTFQPGDAVRITDGPLQGLLAIFEGPTTSVERVQVLLTFLGQVSRAQVPITCLEKTQSEVESSASKRPRRTRGQGRRINNLIKKRELFC